MLHMNTGQRVPLSEEPTRINTPIAVASPRLTLTLTLILTLTLTLTVTVTVTLALPLPLPLTLTLTLTNQVRHGELLAVLVHGEGDRAARLRRARRGGQPLLL